MLPRQIKKRLMTNLLEFGSSTEAKERPRSGVSIYSARNRNARALRVADGPFCEEPVAIDVVLELPSSDRSFG